MGHLIVDVTGRVNTDSYRDHGFALWNSQDVERNQGNFTCEIGNGSVVMLARRGIVFGEGTKSASLESAQGVADIAVHMDADFGAGTLTWSCTDVKNNKSKGPFVVPFTGRAAGIDSISIMLRGSQGAIDRIRIQGN